MFRFVIHACGLCLLAGMVSSCMPSYVPMGEDMTEPHLDGDVFVARDGAKLPFTVWGPRSDPKKIVIAAHSFGEHRDAYALIGEHFSKQDVAVWAFDQRGFGDAPHRGLWSDKETMVTDFRDFTLAVQSEAGGESPLYMVGESMGAAVVLAALANTDIPQPEAIVLSGPGVREDRPRRYWYNAGLWLITRFWPDYEADAERTYDDRLADYHAKRWAEDPRIIDRVRMDTYFGLIRLSDWASNTASGVNVPTLVLFGSEDSQIHPKSLCALMNRLGSAGTLKLFDGKPHLMFQIEEQDMVLPLLENWLREPLATAGAEQATFCTA